MNATKMNANGINNTKINATKTNAIIMLHGLPGSGKSFLADKIKQNFSNIVILKSVNFRAVHGSGSELFNEKNEETKKDKDESYRLMCSAARTLLNNRKIPILDATFHKRSRREWVYALARETNAKLLLVHVVRDETSILDSLRKRAAEDTKDAFLKSVESYEVMKTQFEELNEPMTKSTTLVEVKSDAYADVIEWLKHI